MNKNRIPKNRYNGNSRRYAEAKAEIDHIARNVRSESKPEKNHVLDEIGKAVDAHAAEIGVTVSDIFKFLTITAAVLPNMEVELEMIRLKVDDSGISVKITRPCRECCEDCSGFSGDEDFNEDDWDDEEGLLYDGD